MASRIVLTIGILVPGRTPIFTSRTITYTDISAPLNTLSTVLTNPPFLEFLPVPPPDPEPDPEPEALPV